MSAQVAMRGRLRLIGPLYVRVVAALSPPERWSKAKRSAAIAGEILPMWRPDADNYVKAALDALNGIVFNDDAQVCSLSAQKIYSDKPRLRIEVAPIGVPL